MKLTRKQIREGLEQLPIDSLLLGVKGAKESPLTAKQKAFARGLAMGDTKAGAYRKAYNSKGNSNTVSRKGQELAKRDAVQAYADALTKAVELQALQTPQHLRALVVTELTKHAINEELPPAQRLRALQLLGTVTEVAAFTERREVIKTTNSVDARAQLMDSLLLAIKGGATDVDDTTAQKLLEELEAGEPTDTIDEAQEPEQGQGIESQPEPTPPTPDPPDSQMGLR
jgi:hypothetical protein